MPQPITPDEIDELLLSINLRRTGHWPLTSKDVPFLTCLLLGTIAGSVFLPGFYFCSATYFVWWAFATRMTSSRQRATIIRLASCDDPRAVTPLLHSLTWPDMEKERSVITTAITRLLPNLSAEEFLLLPVWQREVLYRNLSLHDLPLTWTILGAVKSAKDVGALSAVSRLAHRSPRCSEENSTVLAASKCLQILHAERVRRGDAMLRASEAPRPPDVSLLRPMRNEQTDHALLLQPSLHLQDEVQG